MSLIAVRFLMTKKNLKKKKHDRFKSLDKRVTVRLSEYHCEVLDSIASREGVTTSRIIRDLVGQYVTEYTLRHQQNLKLVKK
jgi:predicted DNA binding CopG/RHH family protein